MKFRTSKEKKLKQIQVVLLDEIGKLDGLGEGSRRKNINPGEWGRVGWEFLDKVVDGYPTRANHSDQVQMLDFLTSLGHVLPCARCRANYIEFTLAHPPVDYVGGKTKVKGWLRAYKRKSMDG